MKQATKNTMKPLDIFTISIDSCTDKTFIITNIGLKKISYIDRAQVNVLTKRGNGKNKLSNIVQVDISRAEDNFKTGFWKVI